MRGLRFEWDDRKSARNQRKHGIAFEEAQTVFFDEHGILIVDPDHAEAEERFLLLGLSSMLRTLVVCHCLREEESVIRIISARKANKSEQEDYEGRRRR